MVFFSFALQKFKRKPFWKTVLDFKNEIRFQKKRATTVFLIQKFSKLLVKISAFASSFETICFNRIEHALLVLLCLPFTVRVNRFIYLFVRVFFFFTNPKT